MCVDNMLTSYPSLALLFSSPNVSPTGSLHTPCLPLSSYLFSSLAFFHHWVSLYCLYVDTVSFSGTCSTTSGHTLKEIVFPVPSSHPLSTVFQLKVGLRKPEQNPSLCTLHLKTNSKKYIFEADGVSRLVECLLGSTKFYITQYHRNQVCWWNQ